MNVWSAYRKGANPDDILPMYRECSIEEKTDGYGELNLLAIACQNAHPEAVQYLLEQGMDPNEPSGYGELPLFCLARHSTSCGYVPRKGDVYKTAATLLQGRASVLRKDGREQYCYHLAAQQGNHEFLQALHDNGANITRRDNGGNTGLHLLVEATNNPLRDMAKAQERVEQKKAEADLPEHRRSPVSLQELESQVAEYAQVLENLFLCAVVFMQAGTDVEARNDMDETAHKLAVRRGAKKITALLDGSYSPGDEDGEASIAAGGMTLHQAVRQRDEEAVRAIVAAGADVNEISGDEQFDGLTPLAVACLSCDVPTAALLLELGANPNLKNGAGRPAVAYLFTSQIDINLGNMQKIAAEDLGRKMLRLMVEHGYEINASAADNGDTLLGLACASPHGGGAGRDNVKYMVADEAMRLKADVNLSNISGQTPLMYACIGDFRHMEMIQLGLLEAGADVSKKDEAGNTALHYAACNESARGALTFAELLFEVGQADANAVNNEGKTALDYATARNYVELVKLLLMNM